MKSRAQSSSHSAVDLIAARLVARLGPSSLCIGNGAGAQNRRDGLLSTVWGHVSVWDFLT